MSVDFRKPLSICLAALCASVCAFALVAEPASAAFLFGPVGENAGEINASVPAMAIDQENGDVYVGDQNNERVDEFGPSGAFLLAWGRGVVSGGENAPNEEQICTTECRRGAGGSRAGEFSDADGVAVDNDPSSASHGDVYVVDFGNFRVQKFDSSGKFLLAFGGHVNETTGGNVCVAGEACTRGSTGTAAGEFEWTEGQIIAVGPGGDVYVGDRARVQVFSPEGAWKESISLAGLSSEGHVTTLAVNAAGDVFVKDSEAAGVREFSPAGVEMLAQFDAGSESVGAITLDPTGDLFVTDIGGGVHLLKYAPNGQELDSFAAIPLSVHPDESDESAKLPYSALAFGDSTDELYVDGSDPVRDERRIRSFRCVGVHGADAWAVYRAG